MVVEEEWPQILEALKKFSNVEGRKEYRPKVSIFICGYVMVLIFWRNALSLMIYSTVNAIMPNSGLRILNTRIEMGTHVLER